MHRKKLIQKKLKIFQLSNKCEWYHTRKLGLKKYNKRQLPHYEREKKDIIGLGVLKKTVLWQIYTKNKKSPSIHKGEKNPTPSQFRAYVGGCLSLAVCAWNALEHWVSEHP